MSGTMTREQRIARANEIFARVWPEETNSTLYDVAESARVDLYDAADDLSNHLDDEEVDLRKCVEFWVEHMRKLAVQLESAIETQDVIDRAAS